jgi:hypothetical protein
MRVDREAFLTLTVTIWAASCATKPAATTPVTIVEIPPQPAQPRKVEVAPPAKKQTPAAIVEGGDDDEMLSATQEGDDDDSGGCGFVLPATVVRPSGTCSDAAGTPASCASMQRCKDGDFPFTREKCEAYRRLFKPKIAERAIACLVKLTRASVCDACNTYRCGDFALKGSCPDPSVDATCDQIARTCRSVTRTDCALYLSGMNAEGRKKVAACLARSCSFGIYSCSEGL